MSIEIEVVGRGNAWPIELGDINSRAATLRPNATEYANTSFAIRARNGEDIRWLVLVDVGLGAVSFLTQNGNRLPDALILSHPHFDHIAELDWLCASFKRHSPPNTKLPVYCSAPCANEVKRQFSWLWASMEVRELSPGIKVAIEETRELSLTGLPVYHGPYAQGAMMFQVEATEEGNTRSAVLTCDLLRPLLRLQDLQRVSNADVVYAEANNRFPCPKSGHWSIISSPPAKLINPLTTWAQKNHPSYLVTPHASPFSAIAHAYFDEFLLEALSGKDASAFFSVFDFVQAIGAKTVKLLHYSGYEDNIDFGQPVLDDNALLDWVRLQANNLGLTGVTWDVPPPGNRHILI